jgi:hypothetical protein
MKSKPVLLSCDTCGRQVYSNAKEASLWLVGRLSSRREHPIVRCPVHIGEWALRQAGFRRTMKTYQWAREQRRLYDQMIIDGTAKESSDPWKGF